MNSTVLTLTHNNAKERVANYILGEKDSWFKTSTIGRFQKSRKRENQQFTVRFAYVIKQAGIRVTVLSDSERPCKLFDLTISWYVYSRMTSPVNVTCLTERLLQESNSK